MYRRASKFVLLLPLVVLAACNEPAAIASSDWCFTQPCLEVFGITINQISSSILVFVLAFYGLFVGYKYYKNKGPHTARWYWSVALILGGLGALVAGISFQAFGYELKCVGKVYCDNTSAFEIAYNLLTVYSAAFLLLGISASFLPKTKLKLLSYLSLVISIVYTVLCLNAFIKGSYLFISFEFLLLYIAPFYLSIFGLTAYYYVKQKNEDLRKYMSAWFILMLTIVSYYIYLSLGITEILWAQGIWFSANDVLHLGMMGWLYYVSNHLIGVVEDAK